MNAQKIDFAPRLWARWFRRRLRDGLSDGLEVLRRRDPLSIPGAPVSAWLLVLLLFPLGVWVLRREALRRK